MERSLQLTTAATFQDLRGSAVNEHGTKCQIAGAAVGDTDAYVGIREWLQRSEMKSNLDVITRREGIAFDPV